MPRYECIPDFLTCLPEIDLPIPGARGWLIQGDDQQVVFVEFSETVEVPEHTHAEQWEFVVSGKVELKMDGIIVLHQSGDNFFVPADVPHGALVYAGYRAVIVFNSPDRYQVKSGVDNI